MVLKVKGRLLQFSLSPSPCVSMVSSVYVLSEEKTHRVLISIVARCCRVPNPGDFSFPEYHLKLDSVVSCHFTWLCLAAPLIRLESFIPKYHTYISVCYSQL